jgi:hypothetical protein
MRNMRKMKRDEAGLTTIIAIVLIVLVLIIAALAVVMATGVLTDPGYEKQPDKDLNGDGVEDPIIGYIAVSGKASFDNSNWEINSGWTQQMVDCSMTLQDTSVTMDFFAKIASMFPQSGDYKMKFTVTSPTTDTHWTPATVSFHVSVNAAESIKYITQSPTTTLAIRYHASYHLVAQLLGSDDVLMSQISLDRSF